MITEDELKDMNELAKTNVSMQEALKQARVVFQLAKPIGWQRKRSASEILREIRMRVKK